MCGICGWIRPAGVDLASLVAMTRLVKHRGPDGEGYWLYDGKELGGKWFGAFDVETGVDHYGVAGLGHRRLSIIDLSDAGLQPMSSPDSQQWIIYNGEVYNYLELREELKGAGCDFRTQTDTEVILTAYRQWGLDCFQRFNGMWGIAIVDLSKKCIILSRDRLGVKPLYYWIEGQSLAFASEIKQFLALPGFNTRANQHAISEYIETGYDSSPETFFKNVWAFPPASVAEISFFRLTEIKPKCFWDISQLQPIEDSQYDVTEELRYLFEDAVRLRLRSDVPVGVCLSGGLDSSLIYGQIQRLASDPALTHAFSASYSEKQFDESPFINKVIARHGGHVHYTYPTADNFLKDFEAFIYQHDEPPGSISQYAAWAVMRLARENNVPVLLNGQGGDELFSGYWPAYYLYLRPMLRRPMKLASHLFGAMLPGGNFELIKQIPSHLRQYLFRRRRINCRLLNNSISSGNDEIWASQAQKVSPHQYRWEEIRRIHLPRLLKWDDRNSMAFSIEGRYPFLDYRLVEFALKLPVEVNFYAGWNKYLLRQALGFLLPIEIQWRKDKIGFVTPQSHWLQTALKPMFNDLHSNPSPALLEFVNKDQLTLLARDLFFKRTIHPMDENQHFLFRVFALDVWLKQYKVCL
jgi:asparagine synthase (glutamine-hydrolysing)